MWRGRETKVARSPRVEREREVLLARFPPSLPLPWDIESEKAVPATPHCQTSSHARFLSRSGLWEGGALPRRAWEMDRGGAGGGGFWRWWKRKGSRRLPSDCLRSLGVILAIVDYVSERARDLAGSRAEARTLHGRKDRGKTGGRYFVALIERSMFGMCWRFVLLGVMTAVLTRNGAEICGVENALYLRSSW